MSKKSNMNNNKNDSSSPSPSTSTQQVNKTQVFILRPDILKKLGIASQIPNFQSLTSSENSEKNATTSTKQSIANTTYRTVNKKQNKTKDNRRTISKSAITGTRKRNNKPMVNLPKRGEIGKGKKKKINTKKQCSEIDICEEVKETVIKEEKQKVTNDPASVEEKFNITNSLKSKLSSMLNQKLNMNTTATTTTNDNKTKINTSLNLSETKRSCSTPKITEKQNVSVEKQKKGFANKINDTLPEILPEKPSLASIKSMKMQIKANLALHLGKKPEVQNSQSEVANEHSQTSKQSITKLSSLKEIASNSNKKTNSTSVRKSGRKRKLSNLHDDFVTELKLHDGTETNRNKITKTRKSTDSSVVNTEGNVGSKGVDDVESKQHFGKEKESNISLKIVADSKTVGTKPIVVKTYSRTKKPSPSDNESNLDMQHRLKPESNITALNDNVSNIDCSIKKIDGQITLEELNTESRSIDNENSKTKLDSKSKLGFVINPEDIISETKERNKSIEGSGEKESGSNSESSQSQRKNKIEILEIQTFNQTKQIKIDVLNKADSLHENSKNYAQIPHSTIEPTKEVVEEVQCEKNDSLETNLIENNTQPSSSGEMCTKTNDTSNVTNISDIAPYPDHLLKEIETENNKDILKINLSETCEIQEDATRPLSTKDVGFKQVSSVSSTDKENDSNDKLNNKDILTGAMQLPDTKIIVSDQDKSTKENKMQDKETISDKEILENSKPKQIILNKTVDHLKPERILIENNLSEICRIQEDATMSVKTTYAAFEKVCTVASPDIENETNNKLENKDILIETKQLHDTAAILSNLDKIVKENEMQDEEIILNQKEILEDSKSNQTILNRIVDNLQDGKILNDTIDNVNNITEKSVNDKTRKTIILDSVLETSETESNKQPPEKTQTNDDILISLEASHSEAPTKQYNFEDESKIKSTTNVNVSEVEQESFSAEPNVITSTPIVKRRPGRPRKSNVKSEDSNLVNNSSSKTILPTSENNSTTISHTEIKNTSLLDTIAESSAQNSVLYETVESEITEVHIETPIKKRPGRPKKKPLVQENLKISQSTTINAEIDSQTSVSLLENAAENSKDDDDEPLMKRKPGRPRKIKEDTTDDEEENQAKVQESKNAVNDESISENKRTWKRGRKRKGTIEEENARKKKPVISSDGLVQCAVCKIEIKNSNWANHCAKHNFLTWRVGEAEIDLQDRGAVSSILYKAIKGRKHVFSCETCGDKKKSVVGYLSHLDQCQKTKEEIANMRVACTICNRLMQRVSLKVHMAIHKEKSKLENSLDAVPIDTKSKRQAAKKAVGLIQEVAQEENDKLVKKTCRKAYKKVTDSTKFQLYGGLNQSLKSKIEKIGAIRCQIKKCTFETKNLAELKEHFNNCPELKEDDFVCCYCLHVLDNEAAMIQHVKKDHLKSKEEDSDHLDEEDVEEEDDDDEFTPDDDEIVEKRSRRVLTVTQRKYRYKIGFLAKEKRMLPSLIITYPATIKWTMDFVRENYAEKQLFPKYRSLATNWTLLSEEKYKDYMPDLNKSMCVEQVAIKHTIPCLQGREYNWKEYDLFETDISEDTVTIFCGGPIWSLAWAPTPADMDVDQILAVSIQKNPDKTYKMSQSYSNPEMIQFWNFGILKNIKQLNVLPNLEFCMLHDHGMIWHMEWCPSGCYDEEVPEGPAELRRLGLLAVACSDGNIIIYSIHFPDNLSESNVPKMVKPKEMYKLIVQGPSEQRLGLWNYQATKLSWTKAAGHNIVAGGYSNGMVCLFNLTTESPICKSAEDDVTILMPYLTFHPHCAVITALSLHPLDGGGRWLVTGSWDRSCKYWDLNDISTPITAYLKRGLITDGVWMSHWLCSFLTYDDVFNLSHTVTTIQNVRDYSYKQTSALATNSMITGISANDWANAVAQGSLAGELTGSFPRQLLVSFDVDKGLKCKRVIFGYSELVEKTIEPAERMKKIKLKSSKKDVDFSDKDDKYIFKYFMNKDKEEFDQEPETYNEAQKKYGLVFCDFKLDSYSHIPPDALSWVRQSSRMHEAPLELYPLMSINRVQWNPNKQAYLYLATGHQTGFVRLKCVRFMNTKL